MGRQSSDHDQAMVGSSIALLQERFRRLERARERREEQDLLKLFAQSHPKIIFPLFKPSEDELSLKLNSPSKLSDFGDIETAQTGTLGTFRPTDGIIRRGSPNVENCEVDTTLHL